MSFDVEDVYYSIKHTGSMRAVDERIEPSGSIAFISASGISVDSFLELLRFYLDSTHVAFEDDVFLKKSGVCLGSKVTPIFSDIYLAMCDRAINGRLVIVFGKCSNTSWCLFKTRTVTVITLHLMF